ncbi:bifunctional GNAT family N-acetyltransferase/carbon-nitrogen hydrolase family protein [Aureliella helgolandensis]|uniref:N-carbamoyl-D-amino acid hydrolase n=1 Tax=Aureliella helgolandensis TaxID=2527968 RepID=A0A518G7M1_9BACT|nr:bifunctional GNAT family N-acetyltransferase/carbon-nitrogen hydrolase family protein [Aureliella helgolandensis]QDV24584.1 N-carbamoyl-D-amino acid hydrolase [Aureliella helgolandensis]
MKDQANLDLADFEWNLVVRNTRLEDFETLVEIQKKCFPEMELWTRAQIESQLKHFPEGQFVVECDGRVIASCSSLLLSYEDELEWHNWKKTSDSGFIRNHKPDGNTMYGIEIMVDPDFRGMRLSRRLYEARKEFCRQRNVARIIIGGRIPGYCKHADEMTAREYVDRVVDKSIFDPVLTAQIANGFSVQGLIDNYLPSDVESCGYATFLEWKNFELRLKGARRHRRSVEPVRIGAVQYQMRAVADFDEFARQSRYFVDVAGDYKCDFLLFPELFTTQLLSCMPAQRPGSAARALSEFTPQYLELFTDMAVAFNTNIIGGSHFVVEDDVLYNIAFLFRRDGSIAKQYKLHITPSERRWWGVTGGHSIEVMDTDCGPISIQICYDSEFPEVGRIAAAKGANIFFVPFNTDTRNGYLRVRTCAAARCIENHVYVAIAGCTGNLPFVENADIHYAQTAILTPADVTFARDAIGAEANANIETVIIHDVDLELLRRHREQGSVTNWKDRRRDLYSVKSLETDSEF